MARYSHKGHDTIRYDITQSIAIRYDTIRSESASLYVRTAHVQQQAGNSAQHWSTVVLPINTLTAAGAWILVDGRGDGPAASLRSLRVIQQSYWRLSTAAIVWWPHGRRAAAWLKYLVIAQSLNIWAVCDCLHSQHIDPPDRLGNYCQLVSICLSPGTLHETPFVDVVDGIYRNWELCGISTSFEG